MKTEKEIKELLDNKCRKTFEKKLDIQIRNGQATQGIRKALEWVLNDT